jgi:hypothetical protein
LHFGRPRRAISGSDGIALSSSIKAAASTRGSGAFLTHYFLGYRRRRVYAAVTGRGSYEPWLTRIEQFVAERLWAIAKGVPAEWYGSDVTALERLVEQILKRRKKVWSLIQAFRGSYADLSSESAKPGALVA